MRYFLLFTCIWLVNLTYGQQDSTRTYWLITTDQLDRYRGEIITLDSARVIFKEENSDIISLPLSNVSFIRKKVIRYKPPVVFSEVPSSISSTYLFGDNGFGLDKGEGNYQNKFLLYNEVDYGITEHLSMGMTFIPYPASSRSTILDAFAAASADLHFEFDYFAFGFTGVLGKTFESTNRTTHFNSLSHYVTFGTRNYNITFEAASMIPTRYVEGIHDGYETGARFSIRTMARMTQATRFLFQAEYLGFDIDEDTFLLIPGFRSSWDTFSFDYGLIHVFDLYIYTGSEAVETQIPFLPWIAFSIAF